jgi:hypothetical protein
MTDPSTPYCAVKVEGEDLTDFAVSVTVDESDTCADGARVLFGDSYIVLCDVLHEGLTLEIELGTAGEHAVVFRGPVTSVAAHFPTAGSPSVEVRAHDSLIGLSLRAHTKRWGNATVSSVVRQIALDNQMVPGTISPDDDALAPEERPAQQVAETDLAFLERLARDADAKLYVDHSSAVDSLNLVSNRSLLEADPLSGSLQFNGTLYDFRASFDAWAAGPEASLVSTDPRSGDRVAISATFLDAPTWTPDSRHLARLGDGADRVTSLLARSSAKRNRRTDWWRRAPRLAGAPARPASEHARVHVDRLRHRGEVCRGRTGGNVWLRPRKRVEVIGYGGRWSGVWYLARVRHELDIQRRRYVSSFVGVR